MQEAIVGSNGFRLGTSVKGRSSNKTRSSISQAVFFDAFRQLLHAMLTKFGVHQLAKDPRLVELLQTAPITSVPDADAQQQEHLIIFHSNYSSCKKGGATLGELPYAVAQSCLRNCPNGFFKLWLPKQGDSVNLDCGPCSCPQFSASAMPTGDFGKSSLTGPPQKRAKTNDNS